MAFIRYFIAVPRIILNDQTCSQTDKLVYGMINSLSNNKEYCYASNSYLANQLSVKEKTISNSINNLKRKKYIDVKFINSQRRIYLNETIVSNENSKVLEKNEDKNIVKNYQDKRKEYTRKNYKTSNNLIPYWMEHPEVCKSEEASPEEQAYMEDLLKEFKED
ncbi:MAG: helix-turn-helix domain-containing protein [Bacilli bacterium]|nr:helix-turn-helix domain-containing protein [Bacilli bacterium]